MSFILVSVPTDVNPKATKKKLRTAVEKYSISVMDFKIPKLRVGTLDQLMQLSDELLKVDQQAEQVSKKIERSVYDMIDNKPVKDDEKKNEKSKKKKDKDKKPKFELKVDLDMSGSRQGNKSKGNKREKVDLPPHEYVKLFRWDRLYDFSKPIKHLADDMLKMIIRADDDLKNKMSSYSDFNSAVENIERKETGTLMVKPLGEYVQKRDIVESEHLMTLMIVVPASREQYFLDNYELLERRQKQELEERAKIEAAKPKTSVEVNEPEPTYENEEKKNPEETPEERAERERQEEEDKQEALRKEQERKRQEKIDRINAMCENVVPSSHRKLASEPDFVLFRVVVFKKGAQNVQKLFRQERFTVRQFKYDPDDVKSRQEHKKRLKDQRRRAWNDIVRWCQTYFSRIFKMWIHIKALRCFVETILRYGLPPDFQAYVIDHKPKFREKLRSELKKLYAHLGNSSMMDDDMTGNEQLQGMGMAGIVTGDFFPYVSLDINLEQN